MEMLGIKCITNGVLRFCGFQAQCIALDLLHRSKAVCLSKYTKEQKCERAFACQTRARFYTYMDAQALHPYKTATSGS